MQRVAIGRALVRRPKAMLMDEPIGALDAKLREEMRAEIKRLHLKQGSTTIYVTHDQVEAMSLADRIVIMHEGVLQQVGSPSEVYAHPANLFVAQFVGSPVMNVADGTVARRRRGARGHASTAPPTASPFRANCSASSNGKGRQQTVARHPAGRRARRARGRRRLPAGRGAYHRAARLATTSSTSRSARRCCAPAPRAGFVAKAGDQVFARIDPAQAHFFDTASGNSLGVRL